MYSKVDEHRFDYGEHYVADRRNGTIEISDKDSERLAILSRTQALLIRLCATPKYQDRNQRIPRYRVLELYRTRNGKDRSLPQSASERASISRMLKRLRVLGVLTVTSTHIRLTDFGLRLDLVLAGNLLQKWLRR